MKSIFTFILLLVMTTTTTFAQKSLERYLMSTNKLEVRSGPGANYNTIAEVPQGTQVYVISSGYGEWSTIQYKSLNGFVLTKLLAEDNSMAEAERAAKEAEDRKNAARLAAEAAIARAEEAKRAAAEAARKAIAEAERLTRQAEAEAAAAAAASDAANKNKSAAERRRLAELAETERALAEANKRVAQSGSGTVSTPIESKSSHGGNSKNNVKSASNNATRIDKFASWEKKTYKTGDTPKTFKSFKGKFDFKLDNYLKIDVGSNTDCVVKLVRMGKTEKDDKTVRIVYINSNQTQFIRNIPGGEYYCVIAYGKEWKEDGKGEGQFTKKPLYEKGQDILDFNPIKTPDGINVPSYSLSLDLLPDGSLGYDNSNDDNIDNNAFNKF